MRIVASMNATKIEAPAIVGFDKTIERKPTYLTLAQSIQTVGETAATTQQIPRYMYASCSSESPFGSGTRHYSMSARRTTPMVVVTG